MALRQKRRQGAVEKVRLKSTFTRPSSHLEIFAAELPNTQRNATNNSSCQRSCDPIIFPLFLLLFVSLNNLKGFELMRMLCASSF
jgi:hypothetical protein